MNKKVRIFAFAAVVGLLAGCQNGSTTRPSGAPSGKTPVIFVHGWNSNPGIWNNAVAALKAAGYTSGDITTIAYDSANSASSVSVQLASEVDYLRQYTGHAKVDIVSHSFGSMVAKYCIEEGSCAGKVANWMSLSGADNGTTTADACLGVQASCRDMAGWNDTISKLKSNWPQITTQHVKVEVQWTSNDGVIIPATNSEEPAPAVNVQVSSTLTHHTIYLDATVLHEMVRFLAS